MNDETPKAPKVEAVESGKISRVWIVPIVAFVIGGLVVWQSFAEQGPLIEIAFEQGHGITAGKTEIRYADVTVGLVESISLSEDLSRVLVEARLERFMEPFLGETTQFWVVKADFRGTSVSGLSTILSGAYIEAGWETKPTLKQRKFEGLEQRPLTPPGAAGRHFSLTAPTGASVSIGSPVFYRSLPVGRIEAVALNETLTAVDFTAFVEAPYDQLLGSSTRFWNVSGLDVDVGFDGVRLHFNSVNSLLAGGVAFGNIGRTVGTSVADVDKPYRLYRNRSSAIEAGFEIEEGNGYLLMAEFDESIRGLEAGAPIEWQGILVGRVKDVVFELGSPGSNERRIYAILEMQPSRVGLDNLSDEELRASMTAWVASGMRAQLAAGNVLSGRKLIKLIDDAAPADDSRRIDFAARPYPRLPTIPAPNLDAVSSNVQEIIANFAQLPIDQLVNSLIRAVDGAGAFMTDPALADIPDELREALVSLNGVADNLSDASQDLPQLIDNIITVVAVAENTLSGLSPDSEVYVELSAALSELKDATHAVSELLQTLEDKPNALILGK